MAELKRGVALWIAIWVTVGCIALVLPVLFVAGFTLWGIGEANWPPPLTQAPHVWAMNAMSLVMPVILIAVLVLAWMNYANGKYLRTRMWAIVLVLCTIAWLPGCSVVWS